MALLSDIRTFFGFGNPKGASYPNGNPALVPTTYGPERRFGPGMVDLDLPNRPGGLFIDERGAVTISTVYRSVQLVASTIAALPLDVYERLQDGTRVLRQHDEDRVLWQRPNPEVPSVTFWETVVGHEVLNGNAFIFIENTGEGVPGALWPIHPTRVQVGRDQDGRKIYLIDGQLPMRDYVDGGELIHVPGWGRDGLVGINPIKEMAGTLAVTKAAEEFGGRMFAQGTTMGGVLSTDQTLEPAYAAQLAQAWDRTHAGLANAHKTAVMDRGLKWQQTMINPEDAQMLATRQFQVAEIARIFGVPEFLIGSHDKQSSWGAGLEVNLRAFVQFGLQPHIIRFEQAISDELLRGKRYVKFEIEGLLRGTSAERAAFEQQLYNMGVLSLNEIRELEDRPGIGADGDVRYRPLNMGTVGTDALDPKDAYEAVGALIRAGFSPTASLAALGLPPIEHLGLLPITLQKPVDENGDALPESQVT